MDTRHTEPDNAQLEEALFSRAHSGEDERKRRAWTGQFLQLLYLAMQEGGELIVPLVLTDHESEGDRRDEVSAPKAQGELKMTWPMAQSQELDNGKRYLKVYTSTPQLQLSGARRASTVPVREILTYAAESSFAGIVLDAESELHLVLSKKLLRTFLQEWK